MEVDIIAGPTRDSTRRLISITNFGTKRGERRITPMVEHNPPSSADSARAPVIPLPAALYVSDGLIFDLYDGGQPCRSFAIRWERLVPAKEGEPEAAPQSSQTGLRTHQD